MFVLTYLVAKCGLSASGSQDVLNDAPEWFAYASQKAEIDNCFLFLNGVKIYGVTKPQQHKSIFNGQPLENVSLLFLSDLNNHLSSNPPSPPQPS